MRPDRPDKWLTRVDTLVWRITADDPTGHREIAHPADDAERDALAQFAFTLGLLLQVVVDDDDVNDMPYVMWSVEVPSGLHNRAHIRAVPAALGTFAAHLVDRYPPFVNWSVQIDEHQTSQLLYEQVVRDEYDDLIQAIEVALLPLRTDAAGRVDAIVRVIAVDHPVLIGTYTLYVARDAADRWLVVRAGIADAAAVGGDGDAARLARRYGLRADSPVLVLPRPTEPLFYAQIERGADLCINAILERPPTRQIGLVADFRWVSHSAEQLAAAVLAAAPGWLSQATSTDPD